MNFFTSIYSWFCDSSQTEFNITAFKIFDVIRGDDDELLLSSMFPTIGIVTAIISFLVAIAFYIWPINHPRFKAWWAWLIMLVCNAAINFGLAFAYIHHRVADIEKSEDALVQFSNSEILVLPTSQWIDFAFANLIVSVIFFVIASLILNWFSSNCRFSPVRV